MDNKRELLESILLFILSLLILVTTISIAQQVTESAISVFNTGSSILLSSLLAWLYYKQKNTSETQTEILQSQTEIMESQNEIREIQYQPDLVYGGWDVTTDDSGAIERDRIVIECYNRGEGEAVKCQFGLYCKPASEFDATWEDGCPHFGEIKKDATNHHTNLSLRREDTTRAKPSDRIDSGEEIEFTGPQSILKLKRDSGYCTNANWNMFFEENNITAGDKIVIGFRVDYWDKLGNTYRELPFCACTEYFPDTNVKELLQKTDPMLYHLQDENKLLYGPDGVGI
ncbi:hypothetical protein PM022_00425 [Halorubrum ezzemoulense]|uniref:hypothetical protein n=1 Tax=Halorubrum ezzemoulense TaxID=337243 RepID=UPI00232B5FD9|nr:hypothetical protein [Halorubrum ezzemoulense]MDB2273023.1 hypothetical protein [Halorubrum ezzemoulense]